jgi:hypothetical protein
MNPPIAPIAERIITAPMIESISAPVGEIDSSMKRNGMFAQADPKKPTKLPHLGLSKKKPHTIPATRGVKTYRTK